ncbi:MAG: ferredoxin [Novosphingobium sp.]|nr:ferredoxin [Novosphingobium sp.]
MYVCICNAIREADLRSAARRLHGDAEMLYISLGHEPQCRQCLAQAERIVSEERGTSDMRTMVRH